MQQGWIKIHRSIMDHWLYDEKPFCYSGAWIDLLLRANHEPRKLPVGDQIKVIERGQLFTSYRSLAEHWGWGVKKIKTFLSLLEQDKMIIAERTKSGTLLTIVNYDIYQDCGNTKETPRKHKGNTEETQVEHGGNDKETIGERNKNIKNDKNDKNDKNEKNERNISALRYFPEDDLLEKTFSDFRTMRKQIKAPMTDRAIELMVAKIKRNDPDVAVEMMKQSILNNWKDIYDLKEDKRQNNQTEDLAKKWGIK